MKTILACGGRGYSDVLMVSLILGSHINKHGPTLIVEGGHRPPRDKDTGEYLPMSADWLSHRWAVSKGIPTKTYNADWDRYGLAAGMIRNQEMLDCSRPDIVIAFPGGNGTLDMMHRARKANVPVLEVTQWTRQSNFSPEIEEMFTW